ncbi:hypothetical protein ACHAXR_000237, partial [Thalassiosira sp. AJA248-18]
MGQRQCQAVLFLPIPKQGACERRSINVELLSDLIAESDAEFDAGISLSGGPPEVCIPLSVEKIYARLVKGAADESLAAGVQFLVGTEVQYTHKFRTPFTLYDRLSGIKASLQQVIGFPA